MNPASRLIIGVGNPLAGDDAFGGAVIDRLQRLGHRPAGTDLIDAHTDLLGYIDKFAAYDEVIVVDAVIGAGRSGEVAVFDERTFAAWPDTPEGTHRMSALTALKLFRSLYPDAATRITLVALCIDRVALGTGVSDAAVTAGTETVARLSL